MNQIIVFSQVDNSSSELTSLVDSKISEITKVSTYQSLNNALIELSVDLIVFYTQNFDHDDYEFLMSTRRKGYSRSILVLSHDLSIPSFFESYDRQKLHYLGMPNSMAKIKSLVLKLLENPNMREQRHTRYLTQETVNVENINSGEIISSKMINLSKGGAFCLLENGGNVNEGDVVRIKINLKQLQKNHSLGAKIVWKRPTEKDCIAIGLKFISPDALYRYILEKV